MSEELSNRDRPYKGLDRLQIGKLYRVTDYGSISTSDEFDNDLIPIHRRSVVMIIGVEKTDSGACFIAMHRMNKIKLRFSTDSLIRWESWLELV